MFNRLVAPRVFFAVTLLVVAAACTTKETVQPLVENLEYTRLPSGARIVTGELFNPSPEDLGRAQIQLSLFDENNIRVDEMIIFVRQVPANDRVSFREPVRSDFDVQAARVRTVVVL